MSVDLVIPAYNEEHRLGLTLDAYRTEMPERDIRFLICLDNCTDGTADIVRAHAKQDERVQLFEFPKLGKGGVLIEGFRRADADFVGFVDADCATPPEEMRRLIAAARDADGAIASRYLKESVLPIRRTLARKTLAKVSHRIIQALFRLGYADTQCGAKVMRADVMNNVLPLLTSRDFMFDVDLLVSARRLGYNVVEVPTTWIDRSGSKMKQFDAVRSLGSAVKLWRHYRTQPMKTAIESQRKVVDVRDVTKITETTEAFSR